MDPGKERPVTSVLIFPVAYIEGSTPSPLTKICKMKEADEQECTTKAKWRFIAGGIMDTPAHQSRTGIWKRKMRNAARHGLKFNPFTNLTRPVGRFGVLLVGLMLVGSCQKEWQCTVVTDHVYLGQNYHSENTQTLYGSKEEAEAFEEQNTKSSAGFTSTADCH